MLIRKISAHKTALVSILAFYFLAGITFHIISATYQVFPLLWYYSVVLLSSRAKLLPCVIGAVCISCAPLSGISIVTQALYMLLIAFSVYFLKPVFAVSWLSAFVFTLFFFLLFVTCLQPINGIYSLINIVLIAVIIGGHNYMNTYYNL